MSEENQYSKENKKGQLFDSSQYSQSAESDFTITRSINDIFNENSTEIQHFLKKYSDLYTKSDLDEIKVIEELEHFSNYICDFEGHLNMKLKSYKERIILFSKNFSSDVVLEEHI
jgi:hypothetical protein